MTWKNVSVSYHRSLQFIRVQDSIIFEDVRFSDFRFDPTRTSSSNTITMQGLIEVEARLEVRGFSLERVSTPLNLPDHTIGLFHSRSNNLGSYYFENSPIAIMVQDNVYVKDHIFFARFSYASDTATLVTNVLPTVT